jgi:hypothetical protein
MNYILDNNEKQFLRLLKTARAEGTFDKNAYTYEKKYSDGNINYTVVFFHRDVYCRVDFYSRCGSFSFSAIHDIWYGKTIEKKYCTIKSRFFGLIKETQLDVKHPVVDAALTVHREIKCLAEEKDLSTIQKTWNKLLSESGV